MTVDTRLIGYVPEFDSMAVVSVITALEESFGFVVEEEDEIEAGMFDPVGSLAAFVSDKSSKWRRSRQCGSQRSNRTLRRFRSEDVVPGYGHQTCASPVT